MVCLSWSRVVARAARTARLGPSLRQSNFRSGSRTMRVCRPVLAAGLPSDRSALADQPVVLRLHGRIAFARRLAQAIQVQDLDVPTAVVDEIGVLQGIGDQRHTVA